MSWRIWSIEIIRRYSGVKWKGWCRIIKITGSGWRKMSRWWFCKIDLSKSSAEMKPFLNCRFQINLTKQELEALKNIVFSWKYLLTFFAYWSFIILCGDLRRLLAPLNKCAKGQETNSNLGSPVPHSTGSFYLWVDWRGQIKWYFTYRMHLPLFLNQLEARFFYQMKLLRPPDVISLTTSRLNSASNFPLSITNTHSRYNLVSFQRVRQIRGRRKYQSHD